MKIGVFSNLYPPMERGGAELVAQRVADEFSRHGHEVFVLSTMPFAGLDSLRFHATERHIERVYRFFSLNLYHLTNASRMPFPLRLVWQAVDAMGPLPHAHIAQLLKKEDPDVVFTHNLKGLGLHAARLIQQAGIRHIHTLHDVQLSVPSGLLIHGKENHWMNRGWPRKVYERVAKHALGRPDVVISPSHFLADFYRGRGFFQNDQMHILPNPAPRATSASQRFSVMIPGPVRFLYVGQLEPHKGLLNMLESLSRLSFPFELHIAGDGSLASFISGRAQRDAFVFYHGFISLEHIRKLMIHADAVLVPSVCYENSPTVIYEAFQLGVPVIASRIGGIPELIEDGQDGLLVQPGSVLELVSAMEKIAVNRSDFWSRSSAIKKAAERFSLKRYVDQLEEFL
ncbi:glycosyltransferase [Candidatus Uhrbacteria bacterium]|nr:glycosyltransferase [Candidatus Uhrbacteria bacterium]